MQNYDKAYELAKEIKESEVYQSYLKAKEEAFSNELNKNLYDKDTELTRQVMGAQMAGQPVTDEMQQQYQQLMGVLSLNTELTNFMLAEHRLNQLMSDILRSWPMPCKWIWDRRLTQTWRKHEKKAN